MMSADAAVLEMNRAFKPHEHKKSYDSKYVGEALDDKYARTTVLTAQRRAGGPLSTPATTFYLHHGSYALQRQCLEHTNAMALDCLLCVFSRTQRSVLVFSAG